MPSQDLPASPCPHCGEPVADLCLFCPHCEEPIRTDSARADRPPTGETWKLAIAAEGLLVTILVGGGALVALLFDNDAWEVGLGVLGTLALIWLAALVFVLLNPTEDQ